MSGPCYENQTDEEREDTLEAIRQGLADVEAGRVRPFEDFDREFRQNLCVRGSGERPEKPEDIEA
jgi:hypothetical protein